MIIQYLSQLHLKIKNDASHNCLDTMGRKSGDQVGLSFCHGLGGNQVFAYTKRQQVMSDDNCLDSASKDGPVKLVRCHGMGGNQAWNYNVVVSSRKKSIVLHKASGNLNKIIISLQDKSIRHMNTNRCLATKNNDPSNPVLQECDNSPNQRWIMKTKFKWQAKSKADEDDEGVDMEDEDDR